MPTIALNETPCFYTGHDLDASRTLICIHGAGSDQTIWPSNLSQLADCNLYSLDLPGHGRSGGEAMDRIEDYAAWVDEFVSAIEARRVVLVGHSMGAAIALTLGLARPDWLEAMVLIGCGPRLPVSPVLRRLMQEDHGEAVEQMAASVFSSMASPALVTRFREQARAVDPTVWQRDFDACDHFDLRDRLGEIPQRSLILSGDCDRMTPLPEAQMLEDGMRDARLAVIAPAGHMLPLEQPADMLSAVQRFLAGPTAHPERH